MDQIEELERSLPDRLRAAAEAMPLDRDALAAVRRRARSARRWRRTRVTLAGSAAALALVAGGLVVLDANSTSEITVANGSAAATDGSVAPSEPDAVLVVSHHTQPDLPHEERSDSVTSRLYVGDLAYEELGSPGKLGANSAVVETGLATAFETLDRSRHLPAEEALRAVVESRGIALEEYTPAAGHGLEGLQFRFLSEMILAGMADPSQASEIRRLMEAIPGTTVTDQPDGSVFADSHTRAQALVYDPSTGHPLQRVPTSGAPDTGLTSLAVERVRAADVLVPGRGTPADTAPPTSSPSTTAAGTPG